MDLVCMANDFDVFDDLEAVQHVSRNRASERLADNIVKALRRQLTVKELVASGGVFTGDDLVWLLKGILCVNVPKPYDLVIDDEQREWTVLQVDHAGRYRDTTAGLTRPSFYRLTCRDLVIANDLADTLTIERPTFGQDDSIATTHEPWTTLYANIRGRVQAVADEDYGQVMVDGFKRTYQVFVDRQVAVQKQDRIAWTVGETTTYLEILAVRDLDKIETIPVIDAVRIP